MASGSRILRTRKFKGGRECYFSNISQGRAAIKHLQIKGTRNYYLKQQVIVPEQKLRPSYLKMVLFNLAQVFFIKKLI